VTLRGTQRDALVLPAEAVIRTGKRAIVYIADVDARTGAATGRYRPVEVEIGEQVGEQIEIRHGLAAGQQVVASGQFLIDSEASMQGVMARSQNEPASAATGSGNATTAPQTTPPATSAQPASAAAAPAHDHGTTAKSSTSSAAAPAANSKAVPAAATVPDYGTRGVITEIDAGEITLDHQPVPALKWPGMEMPFKVADKKLLRGVKVGQTVDFRFVKQGEDWQIIRITPVPAASGASK
jgi:Cu(I)/Ag(I) efflux system membrane fusion protein